MNHPVLETLTAAAFVVAIVIAPLAWFRIIRAKSRQAYLKNIALFAGPIALFFVLGQATGLFPETPPPTQPLPKASELLASMPPLQVALLVAAGAVWIVGGNILLYFHNRRLGKSWWQALNPLEPLFKDFTRHEWAILGCLVVITMSLAASALLLHGTRAPYLNTPLMKTITPRRNLTE